MSKPKEKPCLSDLGGLVQVFGGVLVIGAQITIYFAILPFIAEIPLYPIEIRGILELVAQMLLIMITVMILSGSIVIIAGVIAFFKSGAIGGFLAMFFGIAVIVGGIWMMYGALFYPGIAHFAGAILAIVGGVLSIIPGVKGPPKPRTRREKDIVERQKRKR